MHPFLCRKSTKNLLIKKDNLLTTMQVIFFHLTIAPYLYIACIKKRVNFATEKNGSDIEGGTLIPPLSKGLRSPDNGGEERSSKGVSPVGTEGYDT